MSEWLGNLVSNFLGDPQALLVLVIAGFLPTRSGACSGSGSVAALTRARKF